MLALSQDEARRILRVMLSLVDNKVYVEHLHITENKSFFPFGKGGRVLVDTKVAEEYPTFTAFAAYRLTGM